MYEIYADDKLLFSTQYADDLDYKVLAPKVDFSEIGRAGSCSFTMLPGHPLYDYLQEKRTNIKVTSNNTVLFKGRVLSTRKDFYNQKEVQCEGDLAYLLDSQIRPSKFTKTAEDLFRYYIDAHNKQVNPDRRFTVGNIINDNVKTNVSIDESSFQDTKSAIEGNLIDYYGGYLKTRDQNGVTYIDWVKEYGRTSTQTIRFGENLLDLNQEVSPDDIFSILIPIGQDGLTIASVNNGKDYIEIEGAISRWGRIEKHVDFSNITDPSKLKEVGQKYISTNYDGNPSSITLTAINLAHAGVNADDIFIGDKVPIESIPHGLNKTYTCISVSYDLHNSDKTSYTFGKKIQSLSQRTVQNAKNTSAAISEARSSAGRGVGGVNSKLDKYITATDDALTLQSENIALNAQNIALNAEQIDLRATKEEANALGKRINTVEIDLNGDEATIGLKAEVRQTVDAIDGLDSRLSRAEIDINGAEGIIGLKTVTAENREWLENHNGQFEMIDQRVTIAEVNINSNKGLIETKVSKNGVISSINQTAESIVISANKIDLSGYVTASSLSAEVARIDRFFSGESTASQITASSIVTTNLQVNRNTVRFKSMTVVNSFTQASGEASTGDSYILVYSGSTVPGSTTYTPEAGATITF